MKVSIIIPHYNDLASLDLCLAALEQQSFPAEDREIIVADNGSPQGVEAISKVIAKRARLVSIAQKGAGLARNGGVAVSSGEILAFTDADCQPEAQWLAQGIEALSRYDFVGGRINVLVQNLSRVSPVEAFERVFAFNAKNYIAQKGFVATCNLFSTRQVFDAVGEFGVGISEDVDWSHRATRKNFRIGYAPNAVIGHPARQTWSELKRKWIRINSETYALTIQQRLGRVKWILVCILLPLSAVAHTVRVINSDQLTGIGQRMAALGVLFRLRLWRTQDSIRLLVQKRSI